MQVTWTWCVFCWRLEQTRNIRLMRCTQHWWRRAWWASDLKLSSFFFFGPLSAAYAITHPVQAGALSSLLSESLFRIQTAWIRNAGAILSCQYATFEGRKSSVTETGGCLSCLALLYWKPCCCPIHFCALLLVPTQSSAYRFALISDNQKSNSYKYYTQYSQV